VLDLDRVNELFDKVLGDSNATGREKAIAREASLLLTEIERLQGHPPHPTLGRDLNADEFSTSQLVEFLREAAGRDGIGKWRAGEFAQAAARLEEYESAYLAVCPWEAEVERLRASLHINTCGLIECAKCVAAAKVLLPNAEAPQADEAAQPRSSE
jgi:hypothetical protein